MEELFPGWKRLVERALMAVAIGLPVVVVWLTLVELSAEGVRP